jgi:electron transport complex protein RnfG
MKEYLVIAGKLTLICFVAVVLLSALNYVTKDTIEENNRIKQEKANKALFTEDSTFERRDFSFLDDKEKSLYYYFEAYDANGDLAGYSVATIGKGYGGDMNMMVALSTRLSIIDVKLLTNAETPGIGKKAEKSEYMEMFRNTNTNEKPFPYKKSMLQPEYQDSITGATITYNGVVGGIQIAIANMDKELEAAE